MEKPFLEEEELKRFLALDYHFRGEARRGELYSPDDFTAPFHIERCFCIAYVANEPSLVSGVYRLS